VQQAYRANGLLDRALAIEQALGPGTVVDAPQ
jgi:hypothetical protein